jgi:hypothetical protein
MENEPRHQQAPETIAYETGCTATDKINRPESPTTCGVLDSSHLGAGGGTSAVFPSRSTSVVSFRRHCRMVSGSHRYCGVADPYTGFSTHRHPSSIISSNNDSRGGPSSAKTYGGTARFCHWLPRRRVIAAEERRLDRFREPDAVMGSTSPAVGVPRRGAGRALYPLWAPYTLHECDEWQQPN